MFRRILKSTRSGVANIYDCFQKIPQDYSFFVFGTHGVGLHSLLYYLSMMHTKDGKSILPSSMFTFRRDIDWLGDLITLRFYMKMYDDTLLPNIGRWGITFDGGVKKEQWIKKNILHSAPAIVLVRDPALAIASFVNFEIFLQIQRKEKVEISSLKEYALKNLGAIIGYKSNLELFKTRSSKILYIDCSDLQGKQTFDTLAKIANFLDIEVKDSTDFYLSINSPIQRYFSRTLYCGNTPFRLSSLSRVFDLDAYPNYCKKTKWEKVDLGLQILKEWKLSLFCDKNDEIALRKQTSKIEQMVCKELEGFSFLMEEYNKSKIDKEVVFSWLSEERWKKVVIDETSEIPKEIGKKWNFVF